MAQWFGRDQQETLATAEETVHGVIGKRDSLCGCINIDYSFVRWDDRRNVAPYNLSCHIGKLHHDADVLFQVLHEGEAADLTFSPYIESS
jgi:hypothetical protein